MALQKRQLWRLMSTVVRANKGLKEDSEEVAIRSRNKPVGPNLRLRYRPQYAHRGLTFSRP